MMDNAVSLLREKCPLVHCMTNYVTVNDVANAILAIGGSPIMADDIDEAGEIASVSSALVINIGTLNARTIESMVAAGKSANEHSVPVIFDPVGAGASVLRCRTVDRLLSEVRFSIIRGNLSEMSYIAGFESRTKGVDSGLTDKDADPVAVASIVADRFNTVAAITGAVDTIVDSSRVARIHAGCREMGMITGTGCMLTGITGAFRGAVSDGFEAAVAAIFSMGIAGEMGYAEAKDKGTGSLRVAIIDALSRMDDSTLLGHGGVEYASR